MLSGLPETLPTPLGTLSGLPETLPTPLGTLSGLPETLPAPLGTQKEPSLLCSRESYSALTYFCVEDVPLLVVQLVPLAESEKVMPVPAVQVLLIPRPFVPASAP